MPAPGPRVHRRSFFEPATIAPGGRFTATLENFCTDVEPVTFRVDGGAQTNVACRPDGLAIATLEAPQTPGQYDVQAFREDIIASATLDVQAGLGGVEEPLPDTGPEHALALTALGGGLFAAGVVLIWAARSRRPSARTV